MSQPFLSGAAILAAPDLGFEDVNVPEWGGRIRVVQLTAAETARFTNTMATIPDDDGMYLIIIFCARAEDRSRIFVFEHEDPVVQRTQLLDLITQLQGKNMTTLMELQLVALRINKMGVVAKEVLKKD